MIQLSDLKQKIVFENLQDYSKKILESSSQSDIVAQTKLYIRSLAALVLSDTHIDFKTKIQAPPQEIF